MRIALFLTLTSMIVLTSLGAFAQPVTLVTTDSSLRLGSPISARGSNRSNRDNPFVRAKTDSSGKLWQLVPNPWGVNDSATGAVTMTYSGTGSITTTVNLTGVNNAGVNGFPFILYGGDPFGGRIDGQPPKFPAQLTSMSSLICDVGYVLSGTPPGDFDIGYDEWVIPTADYRSGLRGALEIMVLPYFKFTYPPAGKFVRTFTESVTVNGAPVSMDFDEYSTGTGAGSEIILFPKGKQIAAGEVRLNLLDFIKEGAATAGVDSDWWLAGIEFGSEFGHEAAPNYMLTVTKLDIEQTVVSGG